MWFRVLCVACAGEQAQLWGDSAVACAGEWGVSGEPRFRRHSSPGVQVPYHVRTCSLPPPLPHRPCARQANSKATADAVASAAAEGGSTAQALSSAVAQALSAGGAGSQALSSSIAQAYAGWLVVGRLLQAFLLLLPWYHKT